MLDENHDAGYDLDGENLDFFDENDGIDDICDRHDELDGDCLDDGDHHDELDGDCLDDGDHHDELDDDFLDDVCDRHDELDDDFDCCGVFYDVESYGSKFCERNPAQGLSPLEFGQQNQTF